MRLFFDRLTASIIAALLLTAGLATAQQPPAESGPHTGRTIVQVYQRVNFNYNAQPPSASGHWLEISIPIRVDSMTVDGASVPFVDNVRIFLAIAFGPSPDALRYYRAQMEIATLERGSYTIRFYLPEMIVRRYNLIGEPFAWTVNITAAGREQPHTRNSRAQFIQADPAYRGFMRRLDSDARPNDGVLLPSYRSPFADAFPREPALPFVRRPTGF